MKAMEISCEDNMELMARYPDKYFDLAVVDVEWGIRASAPSRKPNVVRQRNGTKLNVPSVDYGKKQWDFQLAPDEYFHELMRVSKNQIIWGVNYYPAFPGGRIVWDKVNGESDQYDCEIAYQSFDKSIRIVRKMWSGMMQGEYCGSDIRKAAIQIGDKRRNEKRIHPTQKPVALYEWIFKNYAKPGDKVLDTHLGSGSIAIALDRMNKIEGMNLTLVACELDPDYYTAAMKRIESQTRQTAIAL